MITRTKILLLTIALTLISTISSYAWLRPWYEDAEVVGRSELIVVGHLFPDSIQYIPHTEKDGHIYSWEYHANLVITETLKGKSDNKEIPIIIHYGLTPLVGGYWIERSGKSKRGGIPDNYPKDIIEIFDEAMGGVGYIPLVKDASQDNLWFLRKRSGVFGEKPGTGDYGIVDPEDLQPLELKDYFKCYLSSNPESSVKKYISENPVVAKRAQNYFDHLEIERILKTPSQQERYEKLLPFYLKGMRYGMKQEAKDGIISCGKTGLDNLVNVFKDSKDHNLRQDIILIWYRNGYKESAPILIDLLKQNNKFWENQHLDKNWWNHDLGSELNEKRRGIYGEIYYATSALRSFKDPKAKEAIELTLKRWKDSDVGNGQIREECEAYFKEFPKN